ncbi:MAG: lipoprotein insertase outer membrane protein LolB [Xanthomonadales bacterium]|nr:lipoprotein insertase outer membrane protein LolB [Xanthomonadales bacterium]
MSLAWARPGVPAVLSALLLLGCASMPPAPVEPLNLSDVLALDRWSLKARLALSNGGDGGSGQLEWHHAPDRSEMRFHGAFGRGSWRLTSEADSAALRLADGTVYTADDVESLVLAQTGWHIPVQALQYWVRGVQSPVLAGKSVIRDAQGRLQRLEQMGWTVVYDRYRQLDNGMVLPRKITATRRDSRIRLIVKSWSLPEPGPAG